MKKIAIVHDYFIWDGGAEKVVRALTKIFPDADVYTGLVLPGFKGWVPENVKTTWVQKLPFLKLLYPLYELLLPFAFESLNLQQYDVIISSTSIFAKGVIGKPQSKHISYIHCPPRFLWGMEPGRQGKLPKLFKIPLWFINNILRIWDYYSAQRPDVLVANSKDDKARIQKAYKRDSIVINPPVEVPPKALLGKTDAKSDIAPSYYLYLGRLVKYKLVDAIIETFKTLPNLELIIAGTGPEEKALKDLSKGHQNISFAGRVPESQKWQLYQNAKAAISINHEDFGIVPVESMMVGTPVIGLNKGGTKETIIHEKTGLLIGEPTVKQLKKAIKALEALSEKEYNNLKKEAKARGKLYSFREFEKKIKVLVE